MHLVRDNTTMMRITLSLVALCAPLLLAAAPPKKIRVLAWSERTEPAEVYPNGINGAIAEFLGKDKGIVVKTADISGPDQGVSDAVLDETDVLIWFGHKKHDQVTAATIQRIVDHVKNGMGYMPVHSSHFALPFKAVLNEIQQTKDVG